MKKRSVGALGGLLVFLGVCAAAVVLLQVIPTSQNSAALSLSIRPSDVQERINVTYSTQGNTHAYAGSILLPECEILNSEISALGVSPEVTIILTASRAQCDGSRETLTQKQFSASFSTDSLETPQLWGVTLGGVIVPHVLHMPYVARNN